MLRLLILFCLLGFALLLFYQNINTPYLKHIPLQQRLLTPFDQRIHYKIGQVDPRFGLTIQDVQTLAVEATQIWQQAEQKQYFVYDPNAQLSINLIYDERQSESNLRQKQLTAIEQQQKTWQQRHIKIEQLNQQISELEKQLKFKRDTLNQAVMQYNQQVQQLNARGGATTEQRFLLEDQKLLLNRQKQQLETQIQTHNQNIAQLHADINDLNQINASISDQVSEFNTRFSGRQFDKGSFDGRHIRIYEFISKDDLRLTLAHEFGHVLGLAHHDDPKGLMYPIMQKQNQQNFQLSPADLKLLSK